MLVDTWISKKLRKEFCEEPLAESYAERCWLWLQSFFQGLNGVEKTPWLAVWKDERSYT